MKGKILKTDKEWVVEIQSDLHGYGIGWGENNRYPLFIDDENIWDGKEVEVEFMQYDSNFLPILVRIKKNNMEEMFYKQADVTYGKGGIVVNATETSMYSKHYNVKITKVDDLYYVTAERPGYDCFLDDQFDPEIVNQVIDEDVELTKPFLGLLGGGKRFVHGWCELKHREHLNISSNNITIVNK